VSADKMRAAFEELAESIGYNILKEIQPLNSYVGATTRLAWYVWQAASAVQAAEIARLTDELAQLKARIVTDTALSVLREHLKIAAVMGDPVTLSSNAAASIFYSMPPEAT
jgi:hypothetical protein